MQQLSFATSEHFGKKGVTQREKFLSEINQVMP